ncbi:hypothetical protein SAMN06295888_1431 [Desulfonatronum zhilinae]|nr:hypothetical protein SAMN06295888_1431 [Desulfonatronum zhilinae]
MRPISLRVKQLAATLLHRPPSQQQGASLIFIIAAILIMSALGVGIVRLTTTSTFTELTQDPYQQARYLAESGLNYALKEDATDGKFLLSDNSYFVVTDENNGKYSVIGTVNPNSMLEASYKVLGLKKLNNFSIYTQEDITLTGSSKIFGHAGTNAGTVSLGWSTVIDGDVHLGPSASINYQNPESLKGEIIKNIQERTFCVYSQPVSPTNCNDLQISSDQTIYLNDNNCYKDITIQSNANVIFNVGNADKVVTVRKFNINQGHININGTGRLIVYIEDSFSMSGDSTLNNNGTPENFILFYSGDENIQMAWNTKYTGAMYAINSHVSLKGSSELRGYVESKSFLGEGDIKLYAQFFNSFYDYCTHPIPEIGFDETGDGNLDDYWKSIGDTDAEYSNAGPTDDGAVRFKGESGLLGLDWHENDTINLDLKRIRADSNGLLSYDIQVKVKVRTAGQKGKFYMMGLNFRLIASNDGIDSGYGVSFFKYTPEQKQQDIPTWTNNLINFDIIKDGIPRLILWKKHSGGNITLIDYANLPSDMLHMDKGNTELNDWATMVVRVDEKFKQLSMGTENHIVAYIQDKSITPKGSRNWNYSDYFRADWNKNGENAIIDDTFDSIGIETGQNEIGVHSFYDSEAQNEQFFADFGLSI